SGTPTGTADAGTPDGPTVQTSGVAAAGANGTMGCSQAGSVFPGALLAFAAFVFGRGRKRRRFQA
ncbi:MAG: hypothetical protein ACJ783_02565, partial [Myxococcales bacterium]